MRKRKTLAPAFPTGRSPYRQPMPFRRKRENPRTETPEEEAERLERVRRYLESKE
jgi:hypothetical protein